MALRIYAPACRSGSHGAVVFSRQVKNLTEEVESLNEDVSKLHRAARAAQETHQQTLEDLHNEEEKLHTLSKVMVAYTGSWDDLPKAKECAESLISQGCDVLLALGDAYSVGVYQACEEKGIKAMGWVSDQSGLSDTVICSGLQSNADVYVATAQSFLDGSFVPGVNVYGMANGAQGMSEFYGLTDEQAAQVKDAMQAYLDGKLDIPTLY